MRHWLDVPDQVYDKLSFLMHRDTWYCL